MKKKILFISHSSSSSGGAEDEFLRMLKYFSLKNEYMIYSACPIGARSSEIDMLVENNYNYRWGWFPVANEGFLAYIKYCCKSLFQFIQFYKIFKSERFDLCVFNVCVLFWPALMAKLFNVKSLVFIRETIMPDWLRKLYYFFLKKITSFFISVSDFNEADFISLTGQHNIETLYSSIEDDPIPSANTEFFNRLGAKNVNAGSLSDKNKFKLLHIGPVSNRKNQYLTLKAADYLINEVKEPNIEFYFIGDNSTDKTVVKKNQQYISDKKLDQYCFFTGVLTRDDLFQMYLHAHAVIIPSLSEGLPLTLVDAFKFKKPVISANCGGMADVIQDSVNGFIVNNYNDKAFAEKIIELKTNETLYNKIVDNAYETYKTKFNLKKNMNRLNEIFHELSYSN